MMKKRLEQVEKSGNVKLSKEEKDQILKSFVSIPESLREEQLKIAYEYCQRKDQMNKPEPPREDG